MDFEQQRYRICYDKLFLPFSPANSFSYKGELIFDVSIYFSYRLICHIIDFDAKQFPGFVLDRDTKELLFISEPGSVKCEEKRFCGYYLNSFYSCEYDPESETGYRMIRNRELYVPGFDILYDVGECYKLVGSSSAYPTKITHEEFCDILLHNGHEFNHSVNKPAQSVSCYIERVQGFSGFLVWQFLDSIGIL